MPAACGHFSSNKNPSRLSGLKNYHLFKVGKSSLPEKLIYLQLIIFIFKLQLQTIKK